MKNTIVLGGGETNKKLRCRLENEKGYTKNGKIMLKRCKMHLLNSNKNLPMRLQVLEYNSRLVLKLKQLEYRFAVIFETLCIFNITKMHQS